MAIRKQYVPPNTLKPNRILATRAVRVRATGAECVINARDFDSALHEDPAADAPSLEGFTVAQLKALADERGVEYADRATKADLLVALQSSASS